MMYPCFNLTVYGNVIFHLLQKYISYFNSSYILRIQFFMVWSETPLEVINIDCNLKLDESINKTKAGNVFQK